VQGKIEEARATIAIKAKEVEQLLQHYKELEQKVERMCSLEKIEKDINTAKVHMGWAFVEDHRQVVSPGHEEAMLETVPSCRD
jgi:hypothetical protein